MFSYVPGVPTAYGDEGDEWDERGDPLTERILKSCFEIMANLGHGFAEAIYQRALALELQQAGIQVDREVRFPVIYKGQEIGIFAADLIAERSVIIELKALDAPLQPFHFGQCLNYMRVSAIPTGLLINFGRPRLEWRRLSLREYPRSSHSSPSSPYAVGQSASED